VQGVATNLQKRGEVGVVRDIFFAVPGGREGLEVDVEEGAEGPALGCLHRLCAGAQEDGVAGRDPGLRQGDADTAQENRGCDDAPHDGCRSAGGHGRGRGGGGGAAGGPHHRMTAGCCHRREPGAGARRGAEHTSAGAIPNGREPCPGICCVVPPCIRQAARMQPVDSQPTCDGVFRGEYAAPRGYMRR
jgi:hypothetical protein